MKKLLVVGAVTSLALSAQLAAAQPAPPPPDVPEAENEDEDGPQATAEVYLGFFPFLEYLDVRGPTVRTFVEEPGHIGTATTSYTELDAAPRGRLTSGTSHVGFRGSFKVAEQLTLVGQMETAMVIDGQPNPWESGFPNRNSYAGVAGDWGSLVVGRLDTPYKWATATAVNPFKAGYVADYTAIIGSPGFLAPSVNADPYYITNPFSNAAFFRHEANFIQYWCPTIYGFSCRAGITTNELRQSDRSLDDGTPIAPKNNPYIASLAAAYDWEGLRVRYAWESHHDYFGMAYIGQDILAIPSFTVPSANDWGNLALLEYTLALDEDLRTRLTAVGEYLIYKMNRAQPDPASMTADNTPGVPYRYARPALYLQLHQTIAEHNVWGAYGRAFDGECSRFPSADGTPAPCVTDKIGAEWIQAGYMYRFTENAGVFFSAYRLRNERSGLYFTAALSREGLSPGLDQLGAGLGLYYTFGANLLE
jgi:hypothetical protein